MSWTCHAKPAANGRTCGHLNVGGITHAGNLCCEKCGCTKAASDIRLSLLLDDHARADA